MPGSTTDLAIPYAIPTDPRANWPVDNQAMSERIAALLRGVQFSIGDGLIGVGSPGDPLKARLSGVFGTAPLDKFGADPLAGQVTYVDPAGNIRATPQALTAAGAPLLTATTLPGYWPVGTTVLQVTNASGSAGDWPFQVGATGGRSGTVVTFRRAGDGDALPVVQQWWYKTTNTDAAVDGGYFVQYRGGSDPPVVPGELGGWGPWITIISDTGWVLNGAAFTANTTNFTMTNAWARRKNGRVQILINGDMKVVSSWPASGSGDIGQLELGTVDSAFWTDALAQQPLTSAGRGRALNGMIDINTNKVYITAIGGTVALAVGEDVSLGGSYLID